MSVDEERLCIDVRVDCPGWGDIDCEGLALACLRAASVASPAVTRPVSILFADDAVVRELNASYRGKDRPTNVLAFPAGEAVWPGHDYLGDIALAFETCRDEAAAKNIPLDQHAAHLMVHGMLHLIGYDHDSDEAADAMERREAEILAKLGIADPYAAPWERKA